MNTLLAKQDLTARELTMVQAEMNSKQKNKGTAYLLWFLLGGAGAHRFYNGDIGYAIGMLLTLGGLGVWTLIDGFLIGKAVEQKNETMELQAIEFVKSMNTHKEA
jgi:hypothetical protein